MQVWNLRNRLRVNMVCEWAWVSHQFMYLVISLFGFEGRIWDLIVSVPDHCLSFYFSIPGERDLPESLNWWSRLELRSHVHVRTHARTHTGKRAHVFLITMALKQKTKVDVQ